LQSPYSYTDTTLACTGTDRWRFRWRCSRLADREAGATSGIRSVHCTRRHRNL